MSSTVWIGKTVEGRHVQHYLFAEEPVVNGPSFLHGGARVAIPEWLAEQIAGREIGMLEKLEVICTEVVG